MIKFGNFQIDLIPLVIVALIVFEILRVISQSISCGG